ncbi:VanZ family protein [Paenibacillus lautus]|uniref:VanZ family protein n=1 Tax=Paenibacillus lautus TaxID=1401 RepID=UPI001C126A4E|nr:VanZ family protein [Paenibacillus lautus]MBU5345787.1 VanZ family protein [Paenibacillus lautus]
MKLSNKWLLLLPYSLYLYVLLKVILFKFGSVDISVLWQQLHRATEIHGYAQNRLQFANFTPFESIRMNMRHLSSAHDVINLFGNIAIFMPNGIFVGLMLRSKFLGFIGSFTTSLGLSLALECSQLVFSMGSFDVDDLILNTAGGVLGYGMFLMLKLIFSGTTLPIDERRERTGKPLTGNERVRN